MGNQQQRIKYSSYKHFCQFSKYQKIFITQASIKYQSTKFLPRLCFTFQISHQILLFGQIVINQYYKMNQLLVDQLKVLSETSKDDIRNPLINLQSLIEGNQYQINKTLVQRLTTLLSELAKQKKINHNFHLTKQALETQNTNLQMQLRHEKQTGRQIRQMEIKKYNLLVNQLKSIAPFPDNTASDGIIKELKRTIEKNNKINMNNSENRSEKLSKEVSNIILQNFKTSRLLLKTEQFVNNIKGNEQEPKTQEVKYSARKQPKLSVHALFSQYIIPNKCLQDEQTYVIQSGNVIIPALQDGCKQQQENIVSEKLLNSVKLQLSQQKHKYRILREKFQQRQTLISSQQVKLLTLQQTVLFLRNELKKNDQISFSLKDDLQQKSQAIQKLKLYLEQKNTQLELISKQKEEMSTKIQNTIVQAQQHIVKNQQLEKQMEKTKHQNYMAVQQSQKTITNHQNKITKLQKSIQFLQDKLLQSKTEKQRLYKTGFEYQKTVKQLKEQREAQRKTQIIQTQQLQNIKQENQKLKQGLTKKDLQLRDIQQQIIYLNEQLEHQSLQIDRLVEQKQRYTQKGIQLPKEIQKQKLENITQEEVPQNKYSNGTQQQYQTQVFKNNEAEQELSQPQNNKQIKSQVTPQQDLTPRKQEEDSPLPNNQNLKHADEQNQQSINKPSQNETIQQNYEQTNVNQIQQIGQYEEKQDNVNKQQTQMKDKQTSLTIERQIPEQQTNNNDIIDQNQEKIIEIDLKNQQNEEEKQINPNFLQGLNRKQAVSQEIDILLTQEDKDYTTKASNAQNTVDIKHEQQQNQGYKQQIQQSNQEKKVSQQVKVEEQGLKQQEQIIPQVAAIEMIPQSPLRAPDKNQILNCQKPVHAPKKDSKSLLMNLMEQMFSQNS